MLVAGLLSWNEPKNIWVISLNILIQDKHLKKVTSLGLYLFQSFLAVCTLLMVVGWFGLLVVDGWQSLAPNGLQIGVVATKFN